MSKMNNKMLKNIENVRNYKISAEIGGTDYSLLYDYLLY